MNTTTAPRATLPLSVPASARMVFAFLSRLQHGSLNVRLPDGREQVFGQGLPHAAIALQNWKPCSAALQRGDVGFAEAYLDGDWTTPCLPSLLSLLLANRRALDNLVYGGGVRRWLGRMRHLLNRNTRQGSRRNIHAHYDLGNSFYRLWLDDSMNYSSALFGGDLAQPMEQAQAAKVRRTLQMAGAAEGSRVLEIGCGWGALMECAVSEFKAHVTGVTLSTEQLAYAQERLAACGNAGLAQMRLQDYRDIDDGPYDAVCSVEMVEAVGREYWPTYFAKVAALLRPGGRACIQSIVIDDALWERYISGTDFIQQYIFPGGCLPCPREFKAQAQAAGLRVVDSFSFGPDYAETLKRWRVRFTLQRAQVLQLGFDERFMRLWDFYLCYCEAAFAGGDVDVVQYTLEKP
jgi:cyclopropane-fatty-acyl-phospholipid synthase